MAEKDFLSWDDSFAIGVTEIDRQHRMLFDLTNGVARAAAAGTGLEGPVKALVEYVEVHFAVEEDLMARSRFPGLDTHKKIHRELAANVTSMVGRLEAGKLDGAELLTFLADWLKNHIRGSDRAYAGDLRKAGFVTDEWERDAKATIEKKKNWWRRWLFD